MTRTIQQISDRIIFPARQGLLTGMMVVVLCFCMASPALALTPNHLELKKALEARLQAMEDQSAQPVITLKGRSLKPEDTHPQIPLIRARLVEYLDEESYAYPPHLYDPFLEKAIKAFQRDHGLKDDAIIGRQTLRYFAPTQAQERAQITRNLLRLESLYYQDRPPMRIEVNIPQATLIAFEYNREVFRMPVVVGAPDRQTPIFMTPTTGVRLNPGWTLPETVKGEDYIPKLREDPTILNNKGIEIYPTWQDDARPINPAKVDWSYFTDEDIKAMRFYKDSGDGNPLGAYRFLMHNDYDIYLHDTDQKGLFSNAYRAASSGCVRVSDPFKIVKFLMADNPDWTDEKIQAVLDKKKEFDLGAKRSIPVYFDYLTAWIDPERGLILGHDPYKFDE